MGRSSGTAAWPLPERGRRDRLRDYWYAGLGFADAELGKVARGLKPGWSMFPLSVAAAAVAAVIVHVAVALLLRAHSGFVQSVGMATMLVVATAITLPLLWAYRRTRRDPAEAGPYAVALLSAAIVIAVAAQAFAALSVYLAARGLVDGEPSLLAAEAAYAWHFLGAVPFLDVTGTLHWEEPEVLQDNLSGALLLAFKIAIIGPVIRLGFSVYRLLEKVRDDGADAPSHFALGRGQITPGTASLAFAVGLPVVAALYVAVSFLFDSGSRPNRWLSGVVPDHVEVPAAELSTSWAHDLSDRLPDSVDWPPVAVTTSWVESVPRWVLAAGFLWVVVWPFLLAFVVDVKSRGPRWRVVGPLGAYACLLLIVVELWSAVTLTLLHSDLLSTDGALPPGEELRSTMSYYAWHAADAIPALDVPQTLNWSLGHEYVGHASDALLLAFKVAFLTILAFPLMRAVRSVSPTRAPEPRRPARLAAAQRYTAALAAVETALGEAEALALRARRGAKRLHVHANAAAARARARAEVDGLRSALTEVERRFDSPAVAGTAGAAVAAAEARLALLGALPQKPKRSLGEARVRLTEAGNAYRAAAMDALLHEEAEPAATP